MLTRWNPWRDPRTVRNALTSCLQAFHIAGAIYICYISSNLYADQRAARRCSSGMALYPSDMANTMAATASARLALSRQFHQNYQVCAARSSCWCCRGFRALQPLRGWRPRLAVGKSSHRILRALVVASSAPWRLASCPDRRTAASSCCSAGLGRGRERGSSTAIAGRRDKGRLRVPFLRIVVVSSV